MDQTKIGSIIREMRLRKNMTQLELGEKIGVSDKAVSKWERGCGAPDISLIPAISEALSVDTKALLCGSLEENSTSSGNLKKIRFYVCPSCHNLLFSTHVEHSDGEFYISSEHEMSREHYISFVAFVSGDTCVLKKLYPQWGLEIRLPYFAHGKLFWYCSKHGLFFREV